MSEDWSWIPRYEERYKVSSLGRVKSFIRSPRGRLLQPGVSYGYPFVILSSGTGKVSNKKIHVLVAITFLGPRPEGLVICHNDGDRRNANVSNLRYDTPSSNVNDMRLHGTMRNGNSGKTHCIRNHKFDAENTILTKRGRMCKACQKMRCREYYLKNKKMRKS